MSTNLSEYLAECFTTDARALRERATKLGSARGPGPTAVQCRAMADACDRVSALFTSATGDDEHEIETLLPTLRELEAAERDDQVRHVYAGAIRRVEALLSEDDDDADDDEDDDDDE